jgi:hypothetical protein
MLALAAWTRLEVLMHVSILMVVLVGLARLFKAGRIDLPRILAPAVVICGSWMAFFLAYGVEGSQAAGAVSEAIRAGPSGWLNEPALRVLREKMLGQFALGGPWGYLAPLALGGIALGARGLLVRPEYRPATLLTAFLGMSAATAVTFYVGSFLGGDVSGWLDRSLTRHFLPAAILLGILAIERLSLAGGSAQRPAGVASQR